MARRGENIYKRKDGRYEGRYIKGRGVNGNPKFGYIYGYTYSEVRTALVLAKAESRKYKGVTVIGKGTLAEFLIFWLETSVKERVKPSTYARYYERIYGHIIPALGCLKIAKASTADVQTFADELLRKNLAPSTISGILGVLRTAMKKACEMGSARHNPCDKVVMPAINYKKAEALDKSQQKNLETAAKKANPGTELAVFLSLYTGMRIGELCALRRRDVDLTDGTITVRGTLQRIKNISQNGAKTIILETAPKSKSSHRTIPLQAELTALLKQRCHGLSDDDFLLSGSKKIIEPRILSARFATLTRKAGVDINFHTLRHTFATRCLEFNFDVQTLAELLGHSNAGVTLSVYAHSVMDHKRELIRKMSFLSNSAAS